MSTVFDIISATLTPLIAGIVGDMSTAVIGILTLIVLIFGLFVLRDVFMHRDEKSDSQKKDRPGGSHGF